MMSFSKKNMWALKDFLYHDYSHDAVLEKFTYDGSGETAKVEFFNPIYGIKTTMIFSNIEVIFAIKGNWYEGNWCGSRKTILGLVAEDDFSYLQTYLPKCSACSEDSLYLVFQMFSGDELHIVAKEVMIDVMK